MFKLSFISPLFIGFTLMLVLSACSEDKKPRPHVTLTPEQNVSYQRSCKTCHEVEATHSPQTGDTVAWDKILDQGMELVVQRAIEGYQGMPPGGQCFECSPEDLSTLILYMAQPKP